MPTVPVDTAPPRQTAVRWRIVGLLMGAAAIGHFNRISISVAGTERILADRSAGIDETQMGMIYSAYLLAYTLCMLPGGWLIDRRGVRVALSLMGFASAAFVALTGLAGRSTAPVGLLFPGLLAARALTGAASAPLHPAAARAVSLWLPAGRRAWGNGLVTAAALLGIASTFWGFGWLMDQFDWPSALGISGGLTALWTLGWTMYATDRPEEHRSVNREELALIEGTRLNTRAATHPPDRAAAPPATSAPRTELVTRSLVLLACSYAAQGYFQYLFFYWLEHYFKQTLEFDTDNSRLLMTIAMLSMALGMMSGGWLCDVARRRFGGRAGAALVAAAGMVASPLFAWLALASGQAAPVVVGFTLAAAAIGTVEGPFWLTAVELGGRRGGLAAALLNTGGNVGGLLSPVVTPILSKWLSWQGGFALAGGVCLLGALLWCWIDPVMPDQTETR